MKQYLLSVHGTQDQAAAPSAEDMATAFAQVEAFNAEVRAAGRWVFAGGLMPPTSATVVRTEGGKTVLTDGPFTETKDALGGFWVIEAYDLGEALAWGAKGSAACMNPVEVRAFQSE